MFSNLFRSINEQTVGDDGAIDHTEFDSPLRMPMFPLEPQTRSDMFVWILSHTPEGQRFTTSKGLLGIVYYDQRGRAVGSTVEELDDASLWWLATKKGFNTTRDERTAAATEGVETDIEPGMFRLMIRSRQGKSPKDRAFKSILSAEKALMDRIRLDGDRNSLLKAYILPPGSASYLDAVAEYYPKLHMVAGMKDKLPTWYKDAKGSPKPEVFNLFENSPPWDSNSELHEYWMADREYHPRPKPSKYTGLQGAKHLEAIGKGYVDLGLVHPKMVNNMLGGTVSGMIAAILSRDQFKGVAWIRDPGDILGIGKVDPDSIARSVVREIAGEYMDRSTYDDEAEDRGGSAAKQRIARAVESAKVTVTSAKGKTGNGYKFVMRPTVAEIEAKDEKAHPRSKGGDRSYTD